jgi:lipopolysaccharide biosynthesis glycosyltransferase
MDVDTIVNGDISELLSVDVTNYIAAAREESNGYFNSGVMIFNLNRMRKDNTYAPLYKLLTKCPYQFPDQDAMNAVFANKVLYLPHKFNALGRADVDHVYETDWIIRHFAGIVKPWKENANEQDKELWEKYKVDRI